MWAKIRHVFNSWQTQAFLGLGVISLIVDIFGLVAASVYFGGVLGWLFCALLFVAPAAICRGLRGQTVPWWIAFLWMAGALFARAMVLVAVGVKDPRWSLNATFAVVVAWQLLRMPNPQPAKVRTPILPGASPEFMTAIETRNEKLRGSSHEN